MNLFDKPFTEIEKDDIEALLDRDENRYLEFKQELNIDTGDEKREFLADISAFANGGGGHLFFGIKEENGIAAEITPIECSNPDKLKLKIDSIIRSNLDPPIFGVEIQPVKIEANAYIIGIQVPNSWNRPHMIKMGRPKFYGRNSGGKYPMDAQEIRSTIIGSETLIEKIKMFREKRIAELSSGHFPMKLYKDRLLVIHVCPIVSFTPGYQCDFDNFIKNHQENLCLVKKFDGSDERHTFNGFMRYSNLGGEYKNPVVGASAEIYRSGIIESVDAYLLSYIERFPDRFSAKEDYEPRCRSALGKYFELLQSLKIPSPCFVFFSLLNVKGCSIYVGLREEYSGRIFNIEQNHLIAPEILVREYTEDAGIVLKSAFDSVWNACGYPGSPNYDKNGKWCGSNINVS